MEFIKLMRLLYNLLIYLIRFKGVVFFAPYPSDDKLGDGYFQRVKAIDNLFGSKNARVYIEYTNSKSCVELKENILRVCFKRYQNLCSRVYIFLLILKGRKIYYHSIYQSQPIFFRFFLYLPFVKKVIDVHGAVPEELHLYEEYENSLLMERVEKITMRKTDYIICVSRSMKNHLVQKYQITNNNKFIILPIFNENLLEKQKDIDVFNLITIYVGGIQKWQNIDLMIESIAKWNESDMEFRIFSSESCFFNSKFKGISNIKIGYKSFPELEKELINASYGFLLRDDNVVNRVACPTKLIEYLAFGVLPILKSSHIGDFKDFGIKYISISDFQEGIVPLKKEFYTMIQSNYSIFDALLIDKDVGAASIKTILSIDEPILE